MPQPTAELYVKQKIKHSNTLGYVPALDGLRAIAVTMVMLLHAHFQLGKNGSLGVDVFFALSGFLITTLLLQEYQRDGDIGLGKFYIRRTVRLFPALYGMLVVVLLYGLFFKIGTEQTIITKEVVASGLYVNNIAWVWGFDAKLLGHTWSLAVEEQFYLVWPWVLLLTLRFWGIRPLQMGLTLFIVLLFINSIFHPFGLPSGEGVVEGSIFIGCLVAIWRSTGKLFFSIPQWVTLACLLVLLVVGIFPLPGYLFLIHHGARSIGGIIAMVAIVGLVQVDPSSWMAKILGSNIMVGFGKISYALYLWHLPVFRWFAWHSTFSPTITFLLKFAVTFLLATASWLLIEKRATAWGRRITQKNPLPVL